MTAHAIVTVTITNPDTFAAYVELAGPAMAKHGATALKVSRAPQVIEGQAPAPTIAVILAFPDRDAVLAWKIDAEIAHVHQMRMDSGTSSIILL